MENNRGELFIFWLGLKWRLKEVKEEGDETQKAVFNRALLAITAHFPYRLQIWTFESSLKQSCYAALPLHAPPRKAKL